MIEELKKELAANPDNPFLQGPVRALESCDHCSKCRHCGPPVGEHSTSGTPLIRCDHPSWEDEETEMREIDPTFAEICSDFERHNAKAKPTTPAPHNHE